MQSYKMFYYQNLELKKLVKLIQSPSSTNLGER